MKAKYYHILGLQEGADQKTIKKAYRKQALKYHPDRNKSEQATKMFILINEAYAILIRSTSETHSPNFKKSEGKGKQYDFNDFETKKRPKTQEELYKERIYRTKKRYEYLKKIEEIENEKYYQKISTGLNWLLLKYVMVISLFLSVIFTLDYLVLPTRFQKDMAISGNRLLTYSGYYHRKIVPLKTEKGAKIWVPALVLVAMKSDPEIFLEKTFFFKDIKYTHYWTGNQWDKAKVDFSVTGSFPLIPLILIVPIATFLMRGRTLTYSLLFNVSLYIFSALLLILLYSNDRWAHILSLGIL